MNHFIIFLLIGIVSAEPVDIFAPVFVPISNQYHSQDGFGQYSYGYSNHLSVKNEVKTADGVTRGAYSYVDAEGKLQSVEYSSDAVNGFRVTASNLPIAPMVSKKILPSLVVDTPAVAEAKAKHLAMMQEAMNKAKTEKEIHEIPNIHSYSFGTDSLYHIQPFIIPNYVSQPIVKTPVFRSFVSQPVISGVVPQKNNKMEMPMGVQDVPEVAKARSEHLAAFEMIKNRN